MNNAGVGSSARFRARVREGLLRRLQPYAARYWKNLCNPASVCHKLTLRCNARCAHCDIWKTDYEGAELTTKEIRRLYVQLRSWLGPVNFVMTGGEALLRPDAVELARHAADLGFLVEFLSNGYLLESAAEELACSGLNRVTISFDGTRPETLNTVRGRDDFFERTVSGVQKLVKQRAATGADFRIWLKTVVMRGNLAELADISRLAASLGVEVCYQPIEQNYAQKYDSQWYEASDLWIEDSGKAAAAIDELARLKGDGLPIVNTESNLKVMSDYFRIPAEMMLKVRAHVSEDKAAIPVCGVGYFEILPWGGVKICGEGEEIGNCRDMSPREIWRRRATCWREGCTVH